MTAASNSDARKRHTPAPDPVEVVVEALRPVVPNTDGVLWTYTHEGGEQQPVTLTYVAHNLIAALRAEGMINE